jgi:hypothetical protein
MNIRKQVSGSFIAISWRFKMVVFCIAFITACMANKGMTQNISSEDQEKINIISAWMQQQMQNGKTPTQAQLDSINKVVKEKYQAKAADTARIAAMNKVTTKADTQKTGTTIIRKQCMVGSSLTVPENKKWKVKRLFVTDGIGGGYNILVNSIKYYKEYLPGDKLTAPVWAAEGSLLSGNDSTQLVYIFEIEETNK